MTVHFKKKCKNLKHSDSSILGAACRYFLARLFVESFQNVTATEILFYQIRFLNSWKKKSQRDQVGPLTEGTGSEKVIVNLLKCQLVVTKVVSSDCFFLHLTETIKSLVMWLWWLSAICTLSSLPFTDENCSSGWIVIKLNCSDNCKLLTRWVHRWTLVMV